MNQLAIYSLKSSAQVANELLEIIVNDEYLQSEEGLQELNFADFNLKSSEQLLNFSLLERLASFTQNLRKLQISGLTNLSQENG